jgi:hypothetical protein
MIVDIYNKKDIMRKFMLLLFLVFTLSFSSCGNYQNVSSQPRITHILAVNELGQQVQVPLSTFTTGLDPYYYNNWRFYWGNNWYYGNNWWFYFNDPYWRPFINNYYYSHPVYYNQGFRVARNNGYRGSPQIRTESVRSQPIRTQTPSVRPQRTETPSVRPQQGGRTETPSVRPQREYRPQTPSVRPQSGGRTSSSGRRG